MTSNKWPMLAPLSETEEARLQKQIAAEPGEQVAISRRCDMKLTADLTARCYRIVEDAPRTDDKYDYFCDADYSNALDQLMNKRPKGPFWIFAYGSLIWKPEFPTVESRRVSAAGWHRAFSMKIARYRGTPEQPGYMMCLDRGGNCDGLALRIPDHQVEDQLKQLLCRELGSWEAMSGVRWIEVRSPSETMQALAFYAAPDELDFYSPKRDPQEVAHALAHACGHWGSGAEYLRSTVTHLEDMGISDAYLWDLQDRVADEIIRRFSTRSE